MRKFIIVLAALLIIAAIWVWWNRPVKVDMTAYVPGDSLVYIEVNDLPRVLAGLTSIAAWRELSPKAGVTTDYDRLLKFSGLAATTGVGKSEWVVLARSQVALVMLGFDAVEKPDAVLKLTPRVALVAETHTSEWRVRNVAEKFIGDFARRSFNSQQVERSEIDGAQFLSWSEPSGTKRKLVAAITGSVLIIGNDEGAVRDCLAVKRGARPSLAGNERLNLMRERLGARDSLTFGFASAGSLTKFVEVFSQTVVTDVSPNPQIQSILANLLPQLAKRIVVEVGWSSRVLNGVMEDEFFMTIPDSLSERLSASLRPEPQPRFGASAYLPQETYQVSRYSFADPALAWKGLNAALASQVSAFEATFIVLGLEALLKPYGVKEPSEFFKATGSEIVTARLNQSSEGKVLIVSVRERGVLREEVRKVLGGMPRAEKVGAEEMLISTDDEQRAASFAGNYLIMGDEDDVRRCLVSHAANKALNDTQSSPFTTPSLFPEPAFVSTNTADDEQVRAVVHHLAGKGGTRHGAALEQSTEHRPYSSSQTRLAPEGFNKKTRSSFGLLGEMIERLSHLGAGVTPDR